MRIRLAAFWFLALVLPATTAKADFTVRECIRGAGSGQGWTLPASSGWKHIGFLTFNHLTDSDYVVTALVEEYEGNAAGTEVEY